jgi:hypothetical protein
LAFVDGHFISRLCHFSQALTAAGNASIKQTQSLKLVATSIGGTGDADNAIEMGSTKLFGSV